MAPALAKVAGGYRGERWVGEYSRSWLEGGTAVRRRWIARLRELGYFEVEGMLEPGEGGPRL